MSRQNFPGVQSLVRIAWTGIALAASACGYDWERHGSQPPAAADATASSSGSTTGASTSTSSTSGAGGVGAAGGEGGAYGQGGAGGGGGGGSSSSSSSSSSGGGSGGGGAIVRCGPGSINAFQETFSSSVLDATKWDVWTDNGSIATVSSGEVVISVPQGGIDSYAYIETATRYSMNDCQASVKVVDVFDAADAYAEVTVEINERNLIGLEATYQRLYAFKQVNGLRVQTASVLYDPIAHAYWRFRETAGVSYWETSPDGASWTTLTSEPDPISLADITLVIGGGADRVGSSLGTIRFDDVNVVP